MENRSEKPIAADNQQGRLESENNPVRAIEDILSLQYAIDIQIYLDTIGPVSRIVSGRGPYLAAMEEATTRMQLVETIARKFEDITGLKLDIRKKLEDRDSR